MGFKVHIFEKDHCVNYKKVNLWKRWHHMHGYYVFSLKARNVSLQSYIANYWPSIHNSTFLIVLTDLYEQGLCHLYTSTRIARRKNFYVFSTLLLCKHPLSDKSSCPTWNKPRLLTLHLGKLYLTGFLLLLII